MVVFVNCLCAATEHISVISAEKIASGVNVAIFHVFSPDENELKISVNL